MQNYIVLYQASMWHCASGIVAMQIAKKSFGNDHLKVKKRNMKEDIVLL